jgi:hypothetical protein
VTHKFSLTGPRAVVVPMTALTTALASTALDLGIAGIVAFGAAGALWTFGLSAQINRVRRKPVAARRVADAFIFIGIILAGAEFGAGLAYGLMMSAAAAAPEEVLSALMKPTVPLFIIFNTPL